MNHLRIALLCLAAFVLASCGGGTQIPQQQNQLAATSGMVQGAPLAAADYVDVLQRLYVGYFGRPADAGGLDFYANVFVATNAPSTMAGIKDGYQARTLPADVRNLIDNFGTSDESKALYPGDNRTFVNAIYRNLFNRDADAAGLDYWAANIDAGRMSRANAAIEIMAGAQTTDATIVSNKASVAASFTAALNTQARKDAYSGLTANAVVRTMLGTVGLATDPASFGATIEATITAIMPAPTTSMLPAVAAIIQTRCVACHSTHPSIANQPGAQSVLFDSNDAIKANAASIYQTVVLTRTMPKSNLTSMTAAERATIATWFESGAQ